MCVCVCVCTCIYIYEHLDLQDQAYNFMLAEYIPCQLSAKKQSDAPYSELKGKIISNLESASSKTRIAEF